jgi:adenylate kinase
MRLTLIGPPGSGKGTQADRIASHLRVPPIHVGALLRRQAAGTTSAARTTQGFLDRGDLLPDRLVTPMVLQRIDQPDCAGGFVLEGFPRRVGQARALDQHLATRGAALDAACYLQVPDEELWRRLAARGRVDDDERVTGLPSSRRRRGRCWPTTGTAAAWWPSTLSARWRWSPSGSWPP